MTPSTKPCSRMTSAYVRDRGMRPVAVTITGSVIELRLKGCRAVEVVDVATLWYQSIKARVMAEKAAKRKAKGKR